MHDRCAQSTSANTSAARTPQIGTTPTIALEHLHTHGTHIHKDAYTHVHVPHRGRLIPGGAHCCRSPNARPNARRRSFRRCRAHIADTRSPGRPTGTRASARRASRGIDRRPSQNTLMAKKRRSPVAFVNHNPLIVVRLPAPKAFHPRACMACKSSLCVHGANAIEMSTKRMASRRARKSGGMSSAHNSNVPEDFGAAIMELSA